jgi:hypothetical protein
MMRWLLRWLRRAVVVLAAVFVAVYAGDWAVYKLRGSPQSTVTVNRYVTIPLKGNKQEFDYLGTRRRARALAGNFGAIPIREKACNYFLRRKTQPHHR